MTPTAEERAELAMSRHFVAAEFDQVAYQAIRSLMARTIREAEVAARMAERDAIMRTLRMVEEDHCVSDEEAKGVSHAIDCIRARSEGGDK